LSPKDRELAWRAREYRIIYKRVGENAAARLADADPSHDLGDRGVLGLVVRANSDLYGAPIGWLAKARPWMWEQRSSLSTNSAYLPGLMIVGAILAVARASCMFLMKVMAARATIEGASRLRRAVYHHTFRLGTLAFRALGPSEAVGVFTRHVEAVHDG